MTQLIDLINIQINKSQTQSISHCNQQNIQQQWETKRMHKLMHKYLYKLDRNYIINKQIYCFNLDPSKLTEQNHFYISNIEFKGQICVKNHFFSIRIFIYSEKGQKIKAQSIYHNILLTKYSIQVNELLQFFKMEFNPKTKQFSFVLQIITKQLLHLQIDQILDLAFQTYLLQGIAHTYVLDLLQKSKKNNFISNITQQCGNIKAWLLNRGLQNSKTKNKFNLNNRFEDSYNFNGKHFQRPTSDTFKYLQTQRKIQKQRVFEQIDNILSVLYPEQKNSCSQLAKSKSTTVKINKIMAQYFNQKTLSRLTLSSKESYQNYIKIKTKVTSDFDYFTLNQKQPQNYNNKNYNSGNNDDEQKTRITELSRRLKLKQLFFTVYDQNTNKQIKIQAICLDHINAKRQLKICQQLTRFQSINMIKQYIQPQNINILSKGGILVNASPLRIGLWKFISRNHLCLSLHRKLIICINLVQSVLSLNLKNKLINYFPSITSQNLQITGKLQFKIRLLTKESLNPLLDLCNLLQLILFFKIRSQRKQQQNQTFKCDQSQNKLYGPSILINLFKFYLIQLTIAAKQDIQFKTTYSINQDYMEKQMKHYHQWIKLKFTHSCQQLLVMFRHAQTLLSAMFQLQLDNTQTQQQ